MNVTAAEFDRVVGDPRRFWEERRGIVCTHHRSLPLPDEAYADAERVALDERVTVIVPRRDAVERFRVRDNMRLRVAIADDGVLIDEDAIVAARTSGWSAAEINAEVARALEIVGEARARSSMT